MLHPAVETEPAKSAPRVTLLSGHYYPSKRRAGFHCLADAFWRAGCEVIFITTQVSWISWLRRDHRFEYPIIRERKRIHRLRERFTNYVWFTPWHPANLRVDALNHLTRRVVRRYADLDLGEIEPLLRSARLFVFESDLSLFLFPRLRSLAPSARFVYRVSDDLRLLKNHPTLREIEMEYAPEFDLVSAPSRFLHERFAPCGNAALHHHGLEKNLFDEAVADPYAPGMRNAVYVGTFNFDYDYLDRASRLFPGVAFHIIGPIPDLPKRDNVVVYGEMPFAATIPYVKFADVGLQPRAYSFGAESFTDSLKVLQYTYCRLPIIAPDFLRSSRPNFHFYHPRDDSSIQLSMMGALAQAHHSIDTSGICSWDELAAILAGDLHAR